MRRGLLVLAVVAACDPSAAGLDATNPDDASPDAARVDAIALDAAIDAPADARIDAPPDATFKDAPLVIDDASVDAPPDAAIPALTFRSTHVHAGIQPSHLPRSVAFVVRNDTPTPVDISASISATIQASIDPAPCTDLLPQQECSFSVSFVAELGAFNGSVTLTAPGVTAQADFDGTGEGFVQAGGDHGGSVTLSPASADCGGNCFPGGTSVTLTALAQFGFVFEGWDDPTCGTTATCVVIAGADPQSREAHFDVAPPVSFEVDFVGDASGEVTIDDQLSVQRCTGSCVVQVRGNQPLIVSAATPARFGGFSAPCAANPCSVPVDTPAISVDFERERNETDLFIEGRVLSVDYDAAGNLAIGTESSVQVLTAGLTPAWTLQGAGVARFDAAGDLFVMTGTDLIKLDASGAELWRRSDPIQFPPTTYDYPARPFIPTHAGGVVVEHEFSLEIWSSDGTLIATPTLPAFSGGSVAVDSMDRIYALIADGNGDTDDLDVFTSDGTELQVMSEVGRYTAQLAIDTTDNVVVASTGHSRADLHRFAVDGTERFRTIVRIDSASNVQTSVAVDDLGDIAWMVADTAVETISGVDLTELTPDGTIEWAIQRPPLAGELFDTGIAPADVASTADHVAVGGTLQQLQGGGGVVLIFDR